MKIVDAYALFVLLVTVISFMLNTMWLNLHVNFHSVERKEGSRAPQTSKGPRGTSEFVIRKNGTGVTVARMNDSSNLFHGEKRAGSTSIKSQTSTHLRPKTDVKVVRKYLVPVMLGNQGPNNQLQALKSTIAFALHRNRTLVLTPFYNHFTLVRNVADDFGPFNDTLDVSLLGKLLPVATVEEFKTQCPRGVEAVLHAINHTWGMSEREYLGTLRALNRDINSRYSNITGIKFPDLNGNDETVIGLPVKDIPKNNMPLPKFLEMSQDTFDSKSRCVAMVYAYGMWKRFTYSDYILTFVEYIKRAPSIRRIANAFVQEFLGGGSYIAVHWRFNSEYKKFWCDRMHTKACIMFKMPPRNVSEVLLSYMKQYNATSVYFASTMSSGNAVIQHLNSTIPRFYMASDLISSSIPGAWKLKGDNYRLSLVEQELCKVSTFFVASRLSSWSDTVVEERLWHNHAYMPDNLYPYYTVS
ncbi:uncharacterized protein [Ptychodera flava]|uniref:uncharacterized protein n=1 Tax=Ptychodera flava TaxID=63121 RepID=UPI003969DBC6